MSVVAVGCEFGINDSRFIIFAKSIYGTIDLML